MHRRARCSGFVSILGPDHRPLLFLSRELGFS
jgi:hypothetical protein